MKKIILVVVILAMVLSIGGCAKDKETTEDTSSNTTSDTVKTTESKEETKATIDPVSITFWNYPNYAVVDGVPGKYEEQMIAAFNAKHPDIEVKIEMLSFDGGPEKVNTAIATNSQPDLIYDYPGRIIAYARQEVMAPVGDMDLKDVPESIVGASSLDGEVYMYPVNTAPFMLGVNKTMVEKAGLLDMLPLDDPERIWTIDEYTAFLRAMKKAMPEIAPMGWYSMNQGGDQGTRAFVGHIYGSGVTTPDLSAYTMNTPEGVKGLQWIIDGIKEGIIISGSEAYKSNDAIDLFLQEKICVTPIYSIVLKTTNASKKVGEWEDILLPLPVPTEADKPKLEAYIGGIGIFDNGDADKVAAAKVFVDFLANDPEWGMKNLKSTGGLSVKSSVTNVYPDNTDAVFAEKTVKYLGTYYNAAPGFAEMRTLWFPELQAATLGVKSAQEALDSFVEKANKTLTN